MTDWESLIPRSLFSILGSGPVSELYSVYLDVLITLRQKAIGSGLRYEDARDIVDDILVEHGVYQLPQDAEFDDGATVSDTTISRGAIVLRRLQKAKWLRRETDKLTGDDVIRFPLYVFKLLPIFIQIQEEQEVEYDALLLSIFSLLSQDGEIPRRQAINRAYQQMVELIDNVQGLLQLIASIRPEVERLDKENISGWVERYLDSQTKGHYTNLKLRNSPDKWYTSIVDKAQELQEECEEIAKESLRSARDYFEQPSPSIVRQISNDTAKQLRYIEIGMAELSKMIQEMDTLITQISRTYSRRVDLVTASVEAQILLERSQTLFELLRALSGRGDPHTDANFVLSGLRAITPSSADWRVRVQPQRSGQFQDWITLEQEDLSPEELRALLPPSSPGPKAIEEHFHQLFGDKQEMEVVDLLGETAEEGQYLIRLINYCGLAGSFGFTVDLSDYQDTYAPPPTVENDFLRATNVTIKRRMTGETS